MFRSSDIGLLALFCNVAFDTNRLLFGLLDSGKRLLPVCFGALSSQMIASSRSFPHALSASLTLSEGYLSPKTSYICRSLFLVSLSSAAGLYTNSAIFALNVVGRMSPLGGDESPSSSEIRLIGSAAGRLDSFERGGGGRGGGRKKVPAGARREPSLEGSFGWNGEEAGTSMMLAGEEDRSMANAKPGLLKICVGCVISRSRDGLRKNADGEQGIVSPANSSISSRPVGTREMDGFRGAVLECRVGGGGDESIMAKEER